ncbi:MAG TPA: glutamate synthase large subunit [Candidatus Baltobacteraceae bacterium]|jgi:glutamate synthase domain-containing protein 2/glutamate synthase domain-containing protein 1/glutamate synthase domain-containing protein 3|nr:glutamate synthase large subunit [Candidatus Baltobacteraceae bacterium]
MNESRHHDACGVGFLADIGGPASHETVVIALGAAAAMAHRGARAADARTCDGGGILFETPRALVARELERREIRVSAQAVAIAAVFLPTESRRAAALRLTIEAAARSAGAHPLFWRVPPVREEALGPHAFATRPSYEHLIVDAGSGDRPERMRRVYDRIDRALAAYADDAVCLVSASATSVVYKALLSCAELGEYFSDLTDPAVRSRFALFHQRFSTNTAPSWRLVQPFRHIAHNGEINTIAGNRAWLRARGVAVGPGSSDSHDLNIAVDAMLDAGYGIDDAVDLLLGASVGGDERLRAYYEAHLPTIEHWDGPAAVAFYHAGVLGAALDRSGFRPLRWCRTASGKIVAASEAGVADFGDDPIVERGRLGPGDRLLVRLNEREVVRPAQFREERRQRGDFRERVRLWAMNPSSGESERAPHPASEYDLRRFGFTREDERDVVGTMASGAGEPVSSMGDDAALACLTRLQPPAAYLRQRFAQVTNPPIDSLREPQVFNMRTYVGSGGIHGEIAPSVSTVALDHAILDERSFDALCADPRLQRHDIALVLGDASLALRIDAITHEAVDAVRSGATLIVLDDRGPGVAVPAVLAAGAVHQSLANAGLRMQSSIVVADGFARDAHSIATAISAGANAVSPWLALRLAASAGEEGAFLAAVRSGLMKIMAKLGICTLRSYVGAQTFEALGLAREVVERCFPAMHAHAPSVGFAALEEDLRTWHAQASEQRGALADLGLFRYRREGVRHAFDPQVIKQLRATAMQGDYEAFQALSDAMERRVPVALRDLLELPQVDRVIDEAGVETEECIIAQFTTAAMSLGALSPEAHEAVARAANLAGARSNSGEGGEHRSRFARVEGNARSAIKQVASARFGVGISYLESADEIEIKIAQGSKPGEGGQIPAGKVTAEIAELRGASAGQALISPPPHHDIYSIEDLAQLIYDLRRGAPQARIAVKLVAQAGIGAIASGVAKAGADVIHISGHDGGTGASPLGSIKHAGLPWELGLCEVHDALVSGGLRERVRLRVDGGFKNGRDVIVAAFLGGDQFGFGSALLVAMGCIYARQCHKNTCPVGIATQDAQLRAKFKGTAEQGAAFFRFVARDVRRRLAALGVRSLEEVRGRRDLLARRIFGDPVFDAIDLSALLAPAPEEEVPSHRTPGEPPHVDDRVALPWRSRSGAQNIVTLRPKDRAVGARVAYWYVRRRIEGLDAPPVELTYRGTAGQSFGAFLTDGITLVLDGEANDYVGKSMEGGRIVVRAPGKAHEPAIGNTCFYGARGGDAFVRGSAGERLCVRNSGARVVVEGAGDHACEYMTAGSVAILGPVGRNLASGMTGGLLFVLADGNEAPDLGPCGVVLTRCSEDDPDLPQLSALLRAHVWLTDSPKARNLLRTRAHVSGRFWKLAPALADRHPEPSAFVAQSR